MVAASVVTAGLSLLGGLFGSRKQKTETTSKVDYQYIRDAASAAGFNPLTALQNGGSANASTVTTGGMGSGAFVSEALEKGLQGYFNGDQFARDQVKDKLEAEMMREQIKVLKDAQRPLQSRDFGFNVPTAKNTSGVDYAAPPVLSRVADGGRGSRGGGAGGGVQPLTPPAMDQYNLYVEVYDPDTKRYTKIPNPDLMDSGPVEVATGLSMIGLADAVQNGVPRAVAAAQPFFAPVRGSYPNSAKSGRYGPVRRGFGR